MNSANYFLMFGALLCAGAGILLFSEKFIYKKFRGYFHGASIGFIILSIVALFNSF